MYPSETYYAYELERPSAAKRLLQRILRYSKNAREPEGLRPGRLLDFGCGAGQYLLSMRDAGWTCAGVEINEQARSAARAAGLDVRRALEGPEGFDGEMFDYVRANHSLEHVVDPVAALASMHRLLRPEGTLFVGIPTASGMNARVFGPYWWHLCAPIHPFVPSTNGFTSLLSRLGFRVHSVGTNGDYGSTTGSLQIALNRNSGRRSYEGVIFSFRPLLLLGHWAAKLQDAFGVGDKLEIVAVK